MWVIIFIVVLMFGIISFFYNSTYIAVVSINIESSVHEMLLI